MFDVCDYCTFYAPSTNNVKITTKFGWHLQFDYRPATFRRLAFGADSRGRVRDNYAGQQLPPAHTRTRTRNYSRWFPHHLHRGDRGQLHSHRGEQRQILASGPDTANLRRTAEAGREARAARRQGRIFSIFSLVRFQNVECSPSGTKNTYTGTCYLNTECAERVS